MIKKQIKLLETGFIILATARLLNSNIKFLDEYTIENEAKRLERNF